MLKNVIAIYINPDNRKDIYISIYGQGILKSTDGGKSWKRVDEIDRNDVIGYFAASPKDAKTIYAATYKTTIYRSKDGGKAWAIWRR